MQQELPPVFTLNKGLNERRDYVVQYIKNVEKHQVAAVLDQNNDEMQGHQYYHLFQNPKLANLRSENRSKSVLDLTRTEMSYNNKDNVVPVFPIRRIEIRKPKEEDDEIEHKIFDSKLKKIVADGKNYQAYKYTDGQKVFTEKEMILRSKLYKIDNVVNGYFKQSNFNVGNQIVKLRDAPEYPVRSSVRGQQLLQQIKNQKCPPNNLQQFSQQLWSSGPSLQNQGTEGALREFLKGKYIRDHQGFKLSATGTRFENAYENAVPEKEIIRQHQEKLKKLQTLEEEENQEELSPSLSDNQDDSSPIQELKKYFRRRHASPKEAKNESDEDLIDYQQEKELAPEIKNMIRAARYDYEAKHQKEFTQQMQKKLVKFNTKLRDYLRGIGAKQVQAHQVQTQSSFGPMGSVHGQSPVKVDVKNRTFESMNESNISVRQHDESSTTDSKSHFTKYGSVLNTTIDNFKEKLHVMKQDPSKLKKKGNKDLVDRLLEDKVQEELKNQRLIKKRRNQEENSMNVIEEFKARDIDSEETKSQFALEQHVYSKMLTKKNTLQTVTENPSQKNKMVEKSKFMLDNLIVSIKDKALHQKLIQEAIRQYNKGGIDNKDIKEVDDDESDVESVTLSKEEDISDVLSHINKKMVKKTEKQKDAESQALQAFLLECEKRKILTKEILKNLKHKQLSFVNQKIDSGLQAALSTFIAMGIQDGAALDSLIFSHNNFTDEQLSALLNPLSNPGAKTVSLVSVKNPIGPDSLKSILKIIRPEQQQFLRQGGQKNKNLQELVLNDSKLLKQVMMQELMGALHSCCSGSLKKLGLANQAFDEPSCFLLKQFVSSTSALKKLDISNVHTASFGKFINIIDAIATENKSIQYLNLAGISYLGSIKDPGSIKTRLRYLESLVYLVQESQTLVHLNLSSCFPGVQVLRGEVRPMVFKSVTVKVDDVEKEELLPYDEILVLFTAISKSKSLQSVHYSGNNITYKTLNVIKNTLKVEDQNGYKTGGITNSKFDEMLGDLNEKIDVDAINKTIQQIYEKDQAKNEDQKALNLYKEMKKRTPRGKQIKNETQKNFGKALDKSPQLEQANRSIISFHNKLGKKPLEENQQKEKRVKRKRVDLRTNIEYKQGGELAGKEGLSIDQSVTENKIPPNDRYVFQRILGHQEIEKGYKWCFREVCWICQKWTYALFVWSPQLGESGELFALQNAHWMQRWEENIMIANKLTQYQQIYNMEHGSEEIKDVHDRPRIVGPGTNFKFKTMTPMYQFIEQVLGNNRSWLRMYEPDEEVTRIKEYKESLHNVDIHENDLHSNNREWPYMIKNYLKYGHKQSYMSISKFVKYGVDLDSKYYAYADLYPPQPQNIIMAVQSRKENKISLISQKFAHRESDIQNLLKRVKKKRLERKFNLQTSLFHSWKTDLQKHYKKCFNADMKYSKIYKFVKDPVDFEAIKAVLLKNYALIFEQYVHGQGKSNYPSVSMVDFTNICGAWKIVDRKDLAISDIDRLFFAVNFEEVGGDAGDLEDNPDKELCRYEFFEIIVRMAKLKFENQKQGLTVAEATDKLLQEYIYKSSLKQTWHSLRSREIWTLEVHDVLEANQSQVKRFVEWWIQNYSSKEGRKTLTLKDIKEMFAQIPRNEEQVLKDVLNLVEFKIVGSFANSKFLVIDEMTSANLLMTMKIDEFYEFICRIADYSQLTKGGGYSSAEEDNDMEDDLSDDGGMKNTMYDQQMGQQMLIQDKVFEVIDLILRLCKDTSLNLRAVKPSIKGLADSESDYDSY